MRTFELGELIAERELVFETLSGDSRNVVVRLGRPAKDPSSRAWLCPYQIAGLGPDRVMAIFGADSMQALLLAIHTIPAELTTLMREQNGRFLHHGQVEDSFATACRTIVDLATPPG